MSDARQVSGMRKRSYISKLVKCGALLLACLPAWAQYAQDPAALAKRNESLLQYFGSAKDSGGKFLPDVTVQISGHESAYTFVTDDQGRFRGYLPLELTPDKMTAQCFKPGFESVRVTMRAGPKGPLRTAQVDCVLRRG